ncbi:MAG: L,D-transpeptidase family protein, partial [Porticoccaceae bacterium]|nr:L,D-transpeptidase family protein [Porticoccaceae bacterium]
GHFRVSRGLWRRNRLRNEQAFQARRQWNTCLYSLSLIRKNIAYLAKNRMRVLDFEGRELDPEIVDWTRPTGILLRQDPGPWNALGHVAFRFDNPFAVYLHDTPDRHLFDQVQRGLSSGCVRVKHALTLANILLQAPVQGPVNPVDVAEVGGRTHNVPVTAEVRLLMSYWTADGREDGRVQFKPDIYQRDRNLIGLWRQLHPLPQGVNNVAHQP